jgi:O-antigen/teichoic acid export membrane protein
MVMIRGALWTSSGYGIVQLVRLVANLFLAKWLAPESFGVLAIANSAQIGLQMVSDVGIGPTIIRDKRGGDPQFLNTLWTLQVIRGLLLAFLALIVSFPLSHLYAVPELQILLAMIAFGSLAGSFSSTALHTLARDQRLARLNVLEVGIQLFAFGTMLVVAWHTRSIWSLAIGGIVHGVLRALLSHIVLPGHRHRIAWDRDALRNVLKFGRWIVLSTLITFLAGQSDRLTLGLIEPLSTLGVYAIASGLALMPREIAGRLADSVILPYLSRSYHGDANELPNAIDRIRSIFFPIGFLASAALSILAPLFFVFLYDDRYEGAARLAPLIVMIGWVGASQVPLQRALLALGDSRSLAVSSFTRWAVGLPASLTAHYFLGPPGFVLGLCLGAIAGAVPLHIVASRYRLSLWKQDVTYTLALAGIILSSSASRSTTADGLIPDLGGSVEVLVPISLLTLALLWTASRVARLAR